MSAPGSRWRWHRKKANPSGQPQEQEIEEVVVLGRAISATQELINERLTDASVIDTLGADTISRLGDSTVGAVLRRLPGLTLVNDKFVFIRGLGERYSLEPAQRREHPIA